MGLVGLFQATQPAGTWLESLSSFKVLPSQDKVCQLSRTYPPAPGTGVSEPKGP